MILLIPSTINFNSLFSAYPPPFRISTISAANKSKDKLAYILNSILVQLGYIDEYIFGAYGVREETNIYVPLYSKILDFKLGHNYKQYIKYLIDSQVIEYHQIRGETETKRYTLKGEHLNAPSSQHGVLDFKFRQNFHKQYSGSRGGVGQLFNDDPEILDAMRSHFEGLEINENAAVAKLEELRVADVEGHGDVGATLKFNRRMDTLTRILSRTFIVTRDYNIRRVHSPVVHLKRELRHCLTWNGQNLVNVDISNSQPFFLNVFFTSLYFLNLQGNSTLGRQFNIDFQRCQAIVNEGGADIETYKEATSMGRFYELLESNLEEPFSTRLELKEAVLETLYTSNGSRNPKVRRIRTVLRELFPTVSQLIWVIKENNYKMLSLLLQLGESRVIIDEIALFLIRNHPEKPFFTVHDSVICLVEDMEMVKNVMREKINLNIQVLPNIKDEYLRY